MKVTALILISIVYLLTASVHLQSLERIISKHPLFIYTVVVLGLLITAMRLQGKAKTILLWIILFFLTVYYVALLGGQ